MRQKLRRSAGLVKECMSVIEQLENHRRTVQNLKLIEGSVEADENLALLFSVHTISRTGI